MTLDELRVEIDAVDDELAALLARRMALAARVAATKRETGAPVLQPAREKAILSRLGAGMEARYIPALETVYEAIFRASREWQEGLA
ncbi:MAG: chorismate mutase [Oscillospiraceae bacterium]|nr:chorismate mutase [Oscillospiraceae bacterium]